MEDINLLESSGIKNIHFVGIGGISMSGLSEILMNQGYRISGSDIKASEITERLKREGAQIYPSHAESNVHGSDLVVYTAAVKEDNPERIEAGRLNIPSVERAVLLGWIMEKYNMSIAVSGTHGKTTTTSMISEIMLEAGKNPTIHIGGVLDSIGGSTRIGGRSFFITEACEYVESFLKMKPYLALLLNIELDHVDYFRDLDHIKEAFFKFISLVPEDGYVVACIDNGSVEELIDRVSCNKLTYGITAKNAMWRAEQISFDSLGCAIFTPVYKGHSMEPVKLNVPGLHNVSNALGAIASCHVLGCDFSSIKAGLLNFSGTQKRFQTKGSVDGIKVIDDYAHHPSEVKATLSAAKNARYKKIWCVFQPHTYTRTKAFLNDFAQAFADADQVIISDIYAAREADKGEIHAKVLADKISESGKPCVYINGFDAIADYLDKNVSSEELIITMGAGDISKVGETFLKKRKGDLCQ